MQGLSGRVVALSTVGSAEEADRLARALVERRLAACVNVVPGVVSHYRWQGELQRDDERLLVIKTRAERIEALRDALRELHPYELPELVAFEITAGSEAYLKWLDDSVLGGAAAHPPRPPARSTGMNPAPLAVVAESSLRAPRARARGPSRGPRRPRSPR
jgi:periplasmic divalent cation tolerance protein